MLIGRLVVAIIIVAMVGVMDVVMDVVMDAMGVVVVPMVVRTRAHVGARGSHVARLRCVPAESPNKE